MNSKPAGYPRFRLFTLNPPFFSWRVRCHKNNGSASIDASRLTFQSAVSFQIRLVAKTSQLIERTLNPKFIERTFTVKNVQNALFFRPVYNSSFSPPYRGVYTIANTLSLHDALPICTYSLDVLHNTVIPCDVLYHLT